MAIALVAAAARSVQVSPLNITLPAEKAVGQLCVVSIVFNQGVGWVTGDLAGPSGFAAEEAITENGTLIGGIVYWKILTQADVDATTIDVTFSGSGNPSSLTTLWTGFDPIDPIGIFASQQNASASSIATPSVNVADAGSTLVVVGMTASEAVQVTAHSYSAYANLAQPSPVDAQGGGGTGAWRRISIAYDDDVAAGATTAYAPSLTGGPAISIGYQFAIRAPSLTGGSVLQLGADGAGKKERTQVFGHDTEGTVHVPYSVNADETTGNASEVVASHNMYGGANYGLAVRSIDESYGGGRTPRTFYAQDVNSSTTEAFFTLTPTTNFATGTAATTHTVTSGKTFRVLSFGLSDRATNATSPPNYGYARLRVNTGGTATTASPIIATASNNHPKSAAIGIGDHTVGQFPDGIDIPAGASLGITFFTGSGTAARTTWDCFLHGYEY